MPGRGLGSPSRVSAQMALMADEVVAEAADTSVADSGNVPALAVFDLDACLWDQEMFTLRDLVDASKPVMGQLGDAGKGVVGARSGGEVRLTPPSRHAARRHSQ